MPFFNVKNCKVMKHFAVMAGALILNVLSENLNVALCQESVATP